MKGKINKRSIESIEPGDKDIFLWDTELPMFGCKITPKGKRVYIIQYRVNGRLRRYTIGTHGVLSANEARKTAKGLLRKVASGRDPSDKKIHHKKSSAASGESDAGGSVPLKSEEKSTRVKTSSAIWRSAKKETSLTARQWVRPPIKISQKSHPSPDSRQTLIETNKITIPGYQIRAAIFKGSKSVLFSGEREEDGASVVIKVPASEHPTVRDISEIRHEYEITKGLNVKGIIKTYALKKYENGVALILEDIGGQSLKDLIAAGKTSLRDFFSLAIFLAETLGELHQKNIIHKDINPNHIIVNPDTGQVRVTGFGNASVLPREDPGIVNPGLMEGTLEYMSPEQTGRMNRVLDYRTDFYSLGLTFYEMLTQKLPFQANHPLELVHCHMAMQPKPPYKIDPGIPKIVSDIVIKLITKTAEERYQSAQGLKVDLEKCQRQLETTGRVEDFPIGRHDISGKLQIAQGLYGRERETDSLLRAFERVSRGQTEMVMVSGYAGIGKTSLVKEIYKPITGRQGYFISGKFDQYKRDIPYSAIINAFKNLVNEVLTEKEEELEQWKEKILAALGPNGEIIIDVIPEIELIIGPQPPVPELEPVESQNRFNLVFRKFIQVLSQKKHPLVIFLDDLQWIDSATLKLVDLMMKDEDLRYFLLIGAYRNNEVDSAHPLMIFLENSLREGALINQITLGPLLGEHVARLIADTLNSDLASVDTLAELVVGKTEGNPFFVNQFLMTLYQEGLLAFDENKRKWTWEMSKIQTLDLTENVVDLLIGRLQRLSSETQHVLSLAACIGDFFDLAALELITGQETAELFDAIFPALNESMIIITSNIQARVELAGRKVERNVTFKFMHDRIQQAAYNLMDQEKRKEAHLQMGRMFLEDVEPENLEDRIFDILNHLNAGVELITLPAEKNKLAELNLIAGKKAKASKAYELAYDYLKASLDLLDKDCWEKQYDLTLNIYNQAVEAAHLSGRFEIMEALAAVVNQKALTAVDKVSVYSNRILGHFSRNELPQALSIGLEILASLGLKLPKTMSPSEIQLALDQIKGFMAGRDVEDFLELPEIRDKRVMGIMQILADMSLPVALEDTEFYVIIVINRNQLLTNAFHKYFSPISYASLGAHLCGLFGDIETGYQIGKIALSISERLNEKSIMSRMIMAFNVLIRPFKEHLNETLEPLLEGYQIGLETGDLRYASFCAFYYCLHAYLKGADLYWLEKEIVTYHEAMRNFNQESTLSLHKLTRQSVMNLLGKSEDPCLFFGETYDGRSQPGSDYDPHGRLIFQYFHCYKLMLCFLFEDFDQAFESSLKVERTLGEFRSPLSPWFTIFQFYDSLTRLAVYASETKAGQKGILHKVSANQKIMERWAHHAPMNFLHKYHLVEAERFRVLGQGMEAIDHYDRAIALAQRHEYPNDEALANELAAKFWLNKGKDGIARLYMEEARRMYVVWGATRKVRDMEEKYSRLLSETPPEAARTAENRVSSEGYITVPASESMDLFSMIKASQAISHEIELDTLLKQLMKIVIENVGAQTGFLILESNGELLLVAQSTVDNEGVLVQPPVGLEEVDYLPTAIVSYVSRTREYVVLNNAIQEGMFTGDPYVKSHRPKSILCAPILYKSTLVGVLYFENNLLSGAFTSERIEVLKLLSSQIAISIENAKLYGDLKKAEAEYRGIFESAVEGIYRATPDGRFLSANPSLARMFGYDSPEELMESITDIEHQLYVSPERSGEFIALIQERKAVSGFEVELYRKDGSRFWVSLHSRPVYNENNKTLYIEGMVTDITEKKMAIEALREREEYLHKENIRLRSNIKDRYKFGNIVGKSPAMQDVYELILRAAATDVNVIIYGESGTGKELVARAIHDMSDRKDGVFFPVNIGAIPEYLVESEFFGYMKGAFTGAEVDKHGYLHLANGGTMFLDELGEIDLNLQVKLLRVLEGSGYMPVGGTEIINPNIRIIAATNRDLRERVKNGQMREDFYYRIHIIPIYLPTLRERKEDISLLIEDFMNTYEYHEKRPPITVNIMEAMMDYNWPGNVRELQNTLHRYITLGRLDFLGSPDRGLDSKAGIFNGEADDENLALNKAMANFEKQCIMRALKRNDWHKVKTASTLKISRATLFNKMKSYGIKRSPDNGSLIN